MARTVNITKMDNGVHSRKEGTVQPAAPLRDQFRDLDEGNKTLSKSVGGRRTWSGTSVTAYADLT
jgi:hypothetical protein